MHVPCLSCFVVINPSTGKSLGSVANMGEEEAQEAVLAAHQAFKMWRKKTAKVMNISSIIVYRFYVNILAHPIAHPKQGLT